MNLKMIGIDHTRAPLDVRQIFAFTRKAMGEALVWLKEQREISGCILLSTCNRMELWLSCEESFSPSAYEVLCRLKQVDQESYRSYFVCRENEKAVEHLFRLASGLESRIVGEDQILTQVKEAAAFAREQYCTDQVLEVLFRMAVTAGKKVKTQVPIQKANFSAAHQALASLREQGYKVKDKNCLVIGNGEMGRITALALKEAGAKVMVTVRQYRSGVIQIPEGCERINYGERYNYMPQCDMVFSATASPNYTITKAELLKLLEKQTEQEQIFIDLAVPRDMEPGIGALPGIRLYDIDSFHIEAKSEAMQRQVREAEGIIREKAEEFFNWYECRDLVPRVQEISGRAAEDAVWRTGGSIKKLGLTKDQQEELQKAMEGSVTKVVGRLLFELRDSLKTENFRECLDALERAYPGEES